MLFKRWTIAVRAMANSMGKKKAKAGMRRVPSPKPEKRVKALAKRATNIITAYSIAKIIAIILKSTRLLPAIRLFKEIPERKICLIWRTEMLIL